MTEKYVYLGYTTYVNKDNIQVYLADVYITNDKNSDLLKILVNKDLIEFLEQNKFEDITNYISVKYNIFSKKYITKINL